MVAASYARILDGETLWLAVEGAVTKVTLRYSAGELTEPTEPEAGGLVSARVPLGPLADAAGEPLEVTVLADDVPVSWSGGPAPGPVRVAMPTRDRRWRWRVADREQLTLVRLPVDPGIVVTRISDDTIELADGRMIPVDELPADGPPLVRAHDDLKRPNFAVALPDGLRWTPEGRLVRA